MFSVLKAIFSRLDSTSILLYIILNLSFAGVELYYGITSNSLTLISDAFHMFFDSFGMIVGLVAQAIVHASWRNELVYTYGYGRADAVAAFANTCFLSFIVFMLTGEAVQRILTPPTVKTEDILPIAGAGLLVNLFGVLVMTANRRGSSRRLAQAQRQALIAQDGSARIEDDHGILLGMLLHVLADTLGSAGVIASAILIEQYQWPYADPACTMFIAFILVFGIVPLMKECINICMQKVPKELESIQGHLLEEIMKTPKVYGVGNPHFWVLNKGFNVASMLLVMLKDTTRAQATEAVQQVKKLLSLDGLNIRFSTIEVRRDVNAGGDNNQEISIDVPLADPKAEKARQKELKKLAKQKKEAKPEKKKDTKGMTKEEKKAAKEEEKRIKAEEKARKKAEKEEAKAKKKAEAAEKKAKAKAEKEEKKRLKAEAKAAKTK